MGGIKQENIAQQIGISRSYVSRIIGRLHKRLNETIENKEKVTDRPFSVKMEENWIKITFFTTDIEKLSQALEDFAANAEEIESFRIKLTNSKVEMCFLADTTSFIYLANILQEMEAAGVRIDD